MTQPYYDIGQIRYLFEMLALELEKQHGYEQISSTVRTTALEWLAEKQRDYKGDAYLDQIERNAVYLGEGTSAVSFASAVYLCEGQPILRSQDEIFHFVFETRTEMPQAIMPFQVNFIRFGCNGCPVHDQHQRWAGLQRLRRMANRADYIEELEFSCIYYQMTYLVGQSFLSTLLANYDLAGIAAMIPLDQVFTVTEQCVRMRTDLWGGLKRLTSLPVFDKMGNLTGWEQQQIDPYPKWRDIWGKEFAKAEEQAQKQTLKGRGAAPHGSAPMNFCPQCGQPVMDQSDRFCRHCGHRLKG